MLKKYDFTVGSGVLTLEVVDSLVDPTLLFDVAIRPYSRRPYLLISKPAARQIPIRPAFMNSMVSLLVDQINDLEGPVLVIGMAEGGIAPGGNMHRDLISRSVESYYTCSTRMRLDKEILFQFEEAHKWALPHNIYLSVDPAIYDRIKTIVIVEDEITTGNTTMNLMQNIVDSNRFKNLKKIIPAAFADWSQAAADKRFPRLSSSVSLLTGLLKHNNISANPVSPEVYEWEKIIDNINLDKDWGRLTSSTVDDCLLLDFTVKLGEKILVIGTTEYAWPPFMLADRLEKQGADVEFVIAQQNTLTVGDTIKQTFVFSDNYGLGINNFLYNVDVRKYEKIIYCAETSADSIDRKLINYLNPILALDI
jgi:hypothetical protein